MPKNYVTANVAFLHPSKTKVSKNSNVFYDRPMLKEILTTFVFLCILFTFENIFLKENNFSRRENNFPIRYKEILNF